MGAGFLQEKKTLNPQHTLSHLTRWKRKEWKKEMEEMSIEGVYIQVEKLLEEAWTELSKGCS